MMNIEQTFPIGSILLQNLLSDICT